MISLKYLPNGVPRPSAGAQARIRSSCRGPQAPANVRNSIPAVLRSTASRTLPSSGRAIPVSCPARNLDVYAADLDRIEVLEGPQGPLFGAQGELQRSGPGVIRYNPHQARS